MVVTSRRGDGATLAPVLSRALSAPVDVGSHPTDDRIMDATVEQLAASGLRKLAVEDVAQRAGVSRMTVYRRFGDRRRLIDATMARESTRLLAAVAAADDVRAEPVDRIVSALTTSLRVARSHPLVAHWLATDPGELLNAVLANEAAVLRAGASYIAATIRGASAAGRRSGRTAKRTASHASSGRGRNSHGAGPDRAADLLVRVYAALVLMPPPSVDLGDARQVESLARELIAPILLRVR